MEGEQLRLHAETLLDVRAKLATVIGRMEDSKSKAETWLCLEHLDLALSDLLPHLDPEWKVTEYIENLSTVADVPYSPAEWTDPPEPPPTRPEGSRDW